MLDMIKKRDESAALKKYLRLLFVLTLLAPVVSACKTKCPSGTVRMSDLCRSIADENRAAGADAPSDAAVASGGSSVVASGSRTQSATPVAGNASSVSGAGAGAAGRSAGPAARSTAGTRSMAAPAQMQSTCGDNMIDPGEMCDGNCPSTCPAPSACHIAMLSGSAASCSATCEVTEIVECISGDGCCAPGCKYPEDSDCSRSCGDGVVDPPELCEATSFDQPCPTQCDDGDPCTKDMLVGSAAECNAECVSSVITRPSSGDACCPSGANAANDDDCETKCGDGVVTGNETCDPMSSMPCPTSCDDGDRCTVDMLVGNASQCDSMCLNMGMRESQERCDGRDNDCNGRVDEGVSNACGGCARLSSAPGSSCNAGSGACLDTGTFECSGKEAVKCSAREKRGSAEVCGDRIDNDCNGQTDECPAGQSCVSSGSAMACSAPLPSGSYRNSCSDCVFDGSTLTCAHCDNGTGGSPSSSLRARCASGQTIANCFGTLGCRDSASKVMQGTYKDSCTGCSYDDCQLHCTSCGDGTGKFLDTTTKDFPCAAGIENCLGRLQCGPC